MKKLPKVTEQIFGMKRWSGWLKDHIVESNHMTYYPVMDRFGLSIIVTYEPLENINSDER